MSNLYAVRFVMYVCVPGSVSESTLEVFCMMQRWVPHFCISLNWTNDLPLQKVPSFASDAPLRRLSGLERRQAIYLAGTRNRRCFCRACELFRSPHNLPDPRRSVGCLQILANRRSRKITSGGRRSADFY